MSDFIPDTVWLRVGTNCYDHPSVEGKKTII